MLPSTIEVEYSIQKNRGTRSIIPAEFRGLFLDGINKQPAPKINVILLIADGLIKAGYAIKDRQMKISQQRI